MGIRLRNIIIVIVCLLSLISFSSRDGWRIPIKGHILAVLIMAVGALRSRPVVEEQSKYLLSFYFIGLFLSAVMAWYSEAKPTNFCFSAQGILQLGAVLHFAWTASK